MVNAPLKYLSKYLSYVLRHAPQDLGIELDDAGWTDVDLLLERLPLKGYKADRAKLEELVATNSKKRFAFDESGKKIRASQGHSVEVELGYDASEPPPVVYHGTFASVLDKVLSEGLQRRSRHHVHLSADRETARQVGSRHGKPVILEVDAAAMHARGHLFYRSENGVWLTDEVPPEYLRLSEQ